MDCECVFVKTRLDFAFVLLKEERNLCSGLLKSRLFLLLDYALKKKKAKIRLCLGRSLKFLLKQRCVFELT